MIMKQKILAVSVAAALTGGIAGSANATLTVVENGVGHALIVPYFTTQGGNATLLNIVNTDTVNGKAVKIRFRSGVDSDDIFDFQVFLSPNDVWTANVSQNAAGLSQLSTTDKSCTLPANVNQAFVTARLVSYTSSDGVVHGVNEQTREGYVEIFNMGNIPPFRPTGVGTAIGTTANPLFTAIKHVSGTPPCTSATLLGIEAQGGVITVPQVTGVTAAVGGANYTTAQQLIMPTTGLMGNWTIINVPKTLAFSGGMPAMFANGINPTGGAPAQTMVVYSGQTGTQRSATHAPASSVAGGTVATNTFPALRLTEDGVLLNQLQNGVITADYDFPDMSTPYEAVPGVDVTPGVQTAVLSAALLRATVLNEFLTDPTINAGTDWVMSMPTRRYHVAGRGVAYGGATQGYPVTESIDGIAGGPTSPFLTANVTYAANGRSACVATGSSPTFYDREENAATGGGAVISPGTPSLYSLCGEVNVLSWNNTGATTTTLFATLIVANSAASINNVTVKEGWARASMGGVGGLPILGDALGKAVNTGVTPNVFFGGTYKHRYQ